MPDRFQACLAETLKWEGGWSNDPVDPGGATMKGVIQVEYNSYRQTHGLAQQTVRQISNAEVQDIYRHNYWVLMRCDSMPAGVDLLAFDFAVNSGTGQAVKSLQRVLGQPIDGHLGAVTMNAVALAAPTQLIRSYMDERRRFLRCLKTFWHFGQGWMSRCEGVEAAALATVTKTPPVFNALAGVPEPLPNPDEQSAQIGKAPAESPAPPVATEASLGVGGLGGLAAAAPKIIERSTVGGKWNSWAFLAAILSEPLFWVGMAALVGTLMFYLHRRRLVA